MSKKGLLKQLFDSQMVGLILLDEQETIELVNDWVLERLVHAKRDCLGDSFVDTFPELEASRLRQAIMDVVRNRLPAILSNSFNPNPLPLFDSQSGESIAQKLHLKPLEYADKVYCLIEIHDVTSAKARETVLRNQSKSLETSKSEAERANQLKSEFLATMSHEIRTPLNGMIGSTSLLGMTEMNSEQSELVATIRQCGENLLAIINDILDFSKIESGKMQLEISEFNLRSCIEDSFDLFVGNESRRNIDLYYDVGGIPSRVRGDITRFRQVVVNLLSNAIKFTKAGEVCLKARTLEESEENTLVEFEVKDSGIGITEDKITLLFNPFIQADASTTREFGGTGLGLSICRSLVEAMGGKIRVESEAGKGSRFIFSVSFYKSETERHKGEDKLVEQISGRSVLVLEHNPNYARLLIEQLEEWGLKTVEAENVHLAKDIIEKKPPDLLLAGLSASAPEELEFVSYLTRKEEGRHIPFVLLHTGLVDLDLSHVSEKAFADLLIKPIKRHQLLNVLVKYLSKETKTQKTDVAVTQELLAKTHPAKILIAEDNQVNQKIIQRMFDKMGYDISIASNGLEAVERVQDEDFDLVFMDIQMPKLDGLMATRSIRSMTDIRQPLIVALTANAMDSDRERCLAEGMDDYIPKPVTFFTLSQKLQELISEQ